MSSIATSAGVETRSGARLEVLFEELSELSGQRNAIETSPGNAHTIATVPHRLESFPHCAQGMREVQL